VLVGINLLREGLDLPEVSLVAILDADKEGFLRSSRSLIQTIGRAARNSKGRVFMYADRVTAAMQFAMDETERRRKVQRQYNEAHGITPETITRAILDVMHQSGERDYYAVPALRAGGAAGAKGDRKGNRAAVAHPESEWVERIAALRQEMFLAAENLEFEKAARLRDELRKLQADANPTLAAAAAVSDSRAPRGGRAVGRGAGPKKRARKTRAS